MKARFEPFSLCLPGGRLWEVRRPVVMVIVNATPDSFHAPSRALDPGAVADMAARLAADGADMIDVGACSTRPGSEPPSAADERERLAVAVEAVRRGAPGLPVSVDTWRADVARAAVEEMGADMVNDISAGALDPRMVATVASLRVPYVMMHTRGTPATMQQLADYPRGVAAEVVSELSQALDAARQAGVADVVLDPGFGFAKTPEQCYELLAAMPTVMTAFPGVPWLAGLSRKSMLYKPLGATAADVLPATTAANTAALLAGASFLRVHDPAAAAQARLVVELLTRPERQ